MTYTVQAYDSEGALIDDEECDTLDDCYSSVDQFVIDGAHSVEVVNGYGDVVWETEGE